jgi:type III secretion protein L
MVSFIAIDNDKLKISPSIKVIKAESFTTVLEADSMLSIARERAEKLRIDAEKAYASERQRGYQDGLNAARHEMASAITVTAIKTEQYIQTLEKKASKLIIEIVKKVIDETDKGEMIGGLLKRALAMMKTQKKITLKVAPVQVEAVNKRLSMFLTSYPQIEIIEVRSDERLLADEVVMESAIGIVDASVDVQLAAIEEAFSKCCRK